VTADELPSISGLKMRSFYNGVLIQEGTTDELIYGVEDLLIELSKVLTVPPNSVVCSGTVGYVGAEDPSEYKLQPMQGVMVAEVEKLGRLENIVAVEQV
jgi:2-keto-4-pentenoate hydratase/2-oxohepta-3-ene-1,7-dioic acid hydratase in catechol pathway